MVPGYRILEGDREPGYRILEVDREPGYRILDGEQILGYMMLDGDIIPGYRILEGKNSLDRIRQHIVGYGIKRYGMLNTRERKAAKDPAEQDLQ